jgi:phosphoserine aminotransferase
MARSMNFNAGPAALPAAALERAREELLDFAGTGMSVMEHSHRGKSYEAVHNDAIARLRRLTGLPDSHEVLFLQGGASQQFATIPLNWLSGGATADYVVTGAWGEKALAEAKSVGALFGGHVRVAASSGEGDGKEKQYRKVALRAEPSPSAAYVHYTSNETIHGVQYGLSAETEIPASGVPLVCDMSSDFLWRREDLARYSLVYAGAQKNVGPSGLVVVIAAKDFIASGRKDIPKIFQYRTHAENNSLYNTPPTFAIYLVRNVLAWIEEQGGLTAIEARNRKKASALYAAIDGHGGFYRCPVDVSSRSVMNVVWRLPSEALENEFVAEASKRGMVGLKGHRSVGGIRASIYNAVEPAWIDALTGFMREFAAAKG